MDADGKSVIGPGGAVVTLPPIFFPIKHTETLNFQGGRHSVRRQRRRSPAVSLAAWKNRNNREGWLLLAEAAEKVQTRPVPP